jgi:membrane protein
MPGYFPRYIAVLKDAFREFQKDQGTLYAAAISFFGLISIIPLFLLAIGVFGYIIGSYDTALQSVLDFAQNFIPTSTEVVRAKLQSLSHQSGLLSGLGLIGLLWAGMQVFVILQQVMNIALGVKQPVGFFRARVIALLMVVVTYLLLGISIVATSLADALRHIEPPPGITLGEIKLFWDVGGILLPLILTLLAFTLVYKYLSTECVATKGAIVGAVTAGVLFELAKQAFRWYVVNIAHFSRIYGSLAGIVVIVFWIYYLSIIVVLGAEVASVWTRRNLSKD